MMSFQLPHVQADISPCKKNTAMSSEMGGFCHLNSGLLQGRQQVKVLRESSRSMRVP